MNELTKLAVSLKALKAYRPILEDFRAAGVPLTRVMPKDTRIASRITPEAALITNKVNNNFTHDLFVKKHSNHGLFNKITNFVAAKKRQGFLAHEMGHLKAFKNLDSNPHTKDYLDASFGSLSILGPNKKTYLGTELEAWKNSLDYAKTKLAPEAYKKVDKINRHNYLLYKTKFAPYLNRTTNKPKLLDLIRVKDVDTEISLHKKLDFWL